MKVSKILLLTGLLFSYAFSSAAQELSVAGEEALSVAAQQNSSFENDTQYFSSGVANAAEQRARPSSVGVFIRMVVVLALVVLCMYAVFTFMRRGMPSASAGDDPFLRRVSSVGLAPGKSVQLVTLLDHAYLLGVSDNAVNLLGTVADKELVDAMNLYADKSAGTSRPRSFSDILSIFMPNGNAGSAYDSATATVSQLMEKQRSRLSEEADDER